MIIVGIKKKQNPILFIKVPILCELYHVVFALAGFRVQATYVSV